MALCTFIIPSIGRTTLINTLESLHKQSNDNWNAIVCYDATPPIIPQHDKIHQIVTSTKLGEYHSSIRYAGSVGGMVRNYAIEYALQRNLCDNFLAFVDDDDSLASEYIKNIIDCQKYNPDIVLFKLKNIDGTIIPKSMKPISQLSGDVGMSFAIKKEVYKKVQFRPSGYEDFDFLLQADLAGLNIYQSDYVGYIVRPS